MITATYYYVLIDTTGTQTLTITLDTSAVLMHNAINSNYSAIDHTHDYAPSSHTHESSNITDFKAAIIDLVYPLGSIYTSMDPTSPSERFGGTWTQIVDRFLYCASSSGTTGGSSTITEANLPSHTHTFNGTNITDSL